jgi:membrane protease subunit HflC
MMGNSRVLAITTAVIAVCVLIVAYSALFVVDQTQQAIVLQFGEFKSVVRDPGLHVKLPFIQDVVYYDRRVLDSEPPTEEVIASDQKRLVVDGFARFRIADPLLFYKSVGTEAGARPRLDSIISASLRRVLGNVTLASVLSAERSNIMKTITEETRVQAKPFGIDVLDVRLRRADLPEENNQAVYARMQSERQREAQEFRAQGDEFAQRIRATAERERTVILAEAQRQSDILRGQGEAESTTTYADAFGKDTGFFAFYRSMQAYRSALEGNNTTFVLTPDSDFFRFFSNPSTAAGAPASGVAPAAVGAAH